MSSHSVLKDRGTTLASSHSTYFFGIHPLKLLLVNPNTLQGAPGSFSSGVMAKKFPPLIALTRLCSFSFWRMKGIFLDEIQWLIDKPINLFDRWNEQDKSSILKRPPTRQGKPPKLNGPWKASSHWLRIFGFDGCHNWTKLSSGIGILKR